MRAKQLHEDYMFVVSGLSGTAGFEDALARRDISYFASTAAMQLTKKVDRKLRDNPDTLDDFIEHKMNVMADACTLDLENLLRAEIGLSMLYRKMAAMPEFNQTEYEELAQRTDIRLQSFLHEADRLYERAKNLHERPSDMIPRLRGELDEAFFGFDEKGTPLTDRADEMQRLISGGYLTIALIETQTAAMLVATRLTFLEEHPEFISADTNRYVLSAIQNETDMAVTMALYARQAYPELPDINWVESAVSKRKIPFRPTLN